MWWFTWTSAIPSRWFAPSWRKSSTSIWPPSRSGSRFAIFNLAIGNEMFALYAMIRLSLGLGSKISREMGKLVREENKCTFLVYHLIKLSVYVYYLHIFLNDDLKTVEYWNRIRASSFWCQSYKFECKHPQTSTVTDNLKNRYWL